MLPPLVTEEQAVISRVITTLKSIQADDLAREQALIQQHRANHAAWTDARGDHAQREAFEEALGESKRALQAHQNARKARDIPLGTPYFGRIILKEPTPGGKDRTQEVLLGKAGVVERGIAICDWRDAPISRLYYNFDEGEEYCEEIGGREREGVLALKRRVDIREGALVEIQGGPEIYRLRPDGAWSTPGRARNEADADHRLPDIVSLITREQFQVITRPNAGVVLLRGRAGSGKTTVALHRIAYLHFQDPRRFRPERVLVVMFNKALQTYIARVLPDLGVEGVGVETFHGWAGRQLRSGGISLPFRSQTPPGVARLKRHPVINELVAAYIDRLGEKSASYLREQLMAMLPAGAPVPSDSALARWDETPGRGLERIARFRKGLDTGRGVTPGWWERLWGKLKARLLDHPRDLWALFEDDALCRAKLPKDLHSQLPAARRHQAKCSQEQALDWEDAALLLRIGQLKKQMDPELSCSWAGLYSHVVIDEAQDLSTIEIEVLVDAADSGRSVTIAGDPAQKILADAQFEGFEKLLGRLMGQVEVRMDQLAVGHRSTRPIMQLAIQALGAHALQAADPAIIAARDGEPVEWLEVASEKAGPEKAGPDEVMKQAAEQLKAFRARRPASLVAVLAKGKTTADAWAKRLEALGVEGVRRASRADFSFLPGVIVSNVHQVKGLEFDGVLLVEPADFQESDRHLLHVAITRAAERLWVACSRGRGLLAG